ncbi:MAG: hemolysin III family protein [Clostridia bacterium]|nr:hemolysin III family protein [Clostridia bacterium]
MAINKIKLIEYSGKVDFFNCLTHAFGAALAVIGFILMILKADTARKTVSALIFGISLVTVYTVSAVYHGLRQGEKKRIARLIDHSAVPFLIAGTASPCALITLYEINIPCSIALLFLAWFCTVFGLVSKLFFFYKLRKVTVAVYIISCAAMLCFAIPFLGEINSGAFGGILIGNALYLIGAAFCGMGIKRPALHIVFHVFTVMASSVHFLVIYVYML